MDSLRHPLGRGEILDLNPQHWPQYLIRLPTPIPQTPVHTLVDTFDLHLCLQLK